MFIFNFLNVLLLVFQTLSVGHDCVKFLMHSTKFYLFKFKLQARILYSSVSLFLLVSPVRNVQILLHFVLYHFVFVIQMVSRFPVKIIVGASW